MSERGPSYSDYDEKLREMGNYLWELDQEGELAQAANDEAKVAEIQQKIDGLAQKAARFSQVEGPHQILANLVRGLSLRMLRRWPEASQAFLDVLDENPLNGEAWLELTWCLSEQGRWADAEMAARKGAEFFPQESAAWGNLAQVLIAQDKCEEASTVLKKAIDLDPRDARNQELLRKIEANASK